jgi:N-acylglucosamine 2-epimerase
MGLSKDDLQAYAAFYRQHLLGDIMPFWESRTRDTQYGGYLTCFDREGRLTSGDKYVWCQGRQVWMFSALYNRIDRCQEWLALARHGRDFLVARAHAGDGRWYYHLDRHGNVLGPSLSLLTDGFALLALCEYAIASGSDEDLPLIRLAFDNYERHFYDPTFDQYHHFTLNPLYLYHGPHMLTINVASVAAPVLGQERTRPIADHCLDKVLNVFAKDEQRVLFEMVARDGSLVDTHEGRMINPGHALESMWFVLHEARTRGDGAMVDRVVQICEWMVEKGFDHEQGGILAFVDPGGKEPFVPQVVRDLGEDWASKIWWVHSESLYTLALVAYLAGRDDFWQHFHHVHEYTQRYFYDPEYGEWYKYLHRDGSVQVGDKGSKVKSAFHIPRALMYLVLLFDGMLAEGDAA